MRCQPRTRSTRGAPCECLMGNYLVWPKSCSITKGRCYLVCGKDEHFLQKDCASMPQRALGEFCCAACLRLRDSVVVLTSRVSELERGLVDLQVVLAGQTS